MDVNGVGRIFGKEFTDENNIKFMKVDKMLVDFRLKKSRFRIRDIFNQGNIIGKYYSTLFSVYLSYSFLQTVKNKIPQSILHSPILITIKSFR